MFSMFSLREGERVVVQVMNYNAPVALLQQFHHCNQYSGPILFAAWYRLHGNSIFWIHELWLHGKHAIVNKLMMEMQLWYVSIMSTIRLPQMFSDI